MDRTGFNTNTKTNTLEEKGRQALFVYDVELLNNCGHYYYHDDDGEDHGDDEDLVVVDNNTRSMMQQQQQDIKIVSSSSSSCWTLFIQYTKHYGRSLPSQKSIKDVDNNIELLLNQDHDLRQRYTRFIETVKLIYSHNNKNKKNSNNDQLMDDVSHHHNHHPYGVTLNKFADGSNNPFPSSRSMSLSEESKQNPNDFFQIWDDDATRRPKEMIHGRGLLEGVEFIPLANAGNILWASGQKHHHKKKKHAATSSSYTRNNNNKIPVLRFPTRDINHIPDNDNNNNMKMEPFSIPLKIDDTIDGIEVDLKKPKKPKKNNIQQQQPDELVATAAASSSSTTDTNTTSAAAVDDDVDPFVHSLNWATTNNPDGVSLVHDVFDQGTCGSCWAYAATGSLEASAARNAASIAYQNYLRDHQQKRRRWKNKSKQSSNSETLSIEKTAIQHAQQAEMEAFGMVNLSVQELIDCDVDTFGDQGCVGGNPLLAFYYIYQYGLTTWEEYPYLGRAANNEDGYSSGFKCRSDLVANPIATASSWGIIPRNREDLIELAIRYIGPVAVGTNGDDPSFMAYSGGIFNKPTCGQGRSNHAMLIVGYGEEEIKVQRIAVPQNETEPTTEVVKYWITRNSWGDDWGENGYIRIQRGKKKHGSGVCGIAANPSVALGGTILYDRQPPKRNPNSWFGNGGGGSSSPQSQSEQGGVFSSFCDDIWEGSLQVGCNRVTRFCENHKAMSLGILSVFAAMILAVYPLSFACRRRKRRRKPTQLTFRLMLDDEGDSPDRSGVMNGDIISSRSKNKTGPTSCDARDDEAGIGVDSQDLVASESTPLMKHKVSNKFRATKLSELATARRQGVDGNFRGSELIIKTT